MNIINDQIDQHYGFGGIMEKIESGLKKAGKDLQSLTADDLAPIDEFHTRGRESTLELAAMANLLPSDVVLDVGCGLGGTARHLAHQYSCSVAGIDLTEEYIAVGKRLTQMVGLEKNIELLQGSALDLSFEDGIFDVAWTEHVQMNIADKNRFYSEIARVLKPGGRFVFHDVFRGQGEVPLYPVPWAQEESMSALATESDIQEIFGKVGLDIKQWIGKVELSINFFKQILSKIEADGPPSIGIHLLMGDTAKEKLRNYLKNLSEDRVVVVMGLAQKR